MRGGKRLSICVACYNQASEVERLLDGLKSQVTDEVEVVIRDDSTNDETTSVVRRFEGTVPIRYFQGQKEGIDKTVIFLVREARGEFVWWMGDDVIAPGGVAAVLNAIKEGDDINFIWANYRLADRTELAIDLPESRYFHSRDELLVLGGTGLGFMSAAVFRREPALAGISPAEKHVGSAFVTLFLVLYVISRPGRHYYLRGPIVICHPATTEEIRKVVVKEDGRIKNEAFEVFGINFAEIIREFSGSFGKNAIRRTIKKSFGQTWRGVLVAYVGGWDTPRGKRVKLLRYFWTFPEAWVAFPLFLMPRIMLSPLYRLYRSIFRREKRVPSVDLNVQATTTSAVADMREPGKIDKS